MQKKTSLARYIIGIDLGTTNCAVAYIDTLEPQSRPHFLAISQWERQDATIEAYTLPSFLYLPPKAAWKKDAKRLAFQSPDREITYVTGRAAREETFKAPDRVIHSAKSWLTHSGVNRREALLPWNSDEILGDDRKSPIEVSAEFLIHIREVWDYTIGKFEESYHFVNQDIIITVPASFDEVAQQLTLEAAQLAGYPESLRLVEEPQAAFYYWLMHLGDRELSSDALLKAMPDLTAKGQTVLICDIGGGTTDFSLFEIKPMDSAKAIPEINRIAVSPHILLGGDNIDLAIAYDLEAKLRPGATLPSHSWAQLVAKSRELKERLLSSKLKESESYHFSITMASSSSLFGSTLSAEVKPDELKAKILEGFFPVCRANDGISSQRHGLQDFGLSYAQDSAVTRHLGAFLAGRKVDAVLYTGGSLSPEFLQQRLSAIIGDWQGALPVVLENKAMDLAVAGGAAAYGKVLRTPEQRIKGGYGRTLYLEVMDESQNSKALLCLLPKGFDDHKPITIQNHALKLVINQPVRFQLYTSNTNEKERPGDIVPLQISRLHPLPAVETTIDDRSQKRSPQPKLINVHLTANIRETGVLELALVANEGLTMPNSWQLSFNLRSDATFIVDEEASSATAKNHPLIISERFSSASQKIAALYGKKSEGTSPTSITRELELTLGEERKAWDTQLLRALWEPLKPGITRRQRSVGHESSWFYLAGYLLRPGYGIPLDSFRVDELWRVFKLGVEHPKEARVLNQWWIMWRRIAGGLDKDQQEQIFAKIYPAIRNQSGASPEMILLAGSLERVDMNKKILLGHKLVDQICARSAHLEQKIWALSRIASRIPLYGGSQVIVRPKFIEEWFTAFKNLNYSDKRFIKLNQFFSQAGRIINDREFDLPDELRQKFLDKMQQTGATALEIDVVREYVEIDRETQNLLFGEALPTGFILAQQ